MRCENIVLLLLLDFELEVLGLIQQVLVRIGDDLMLPILIQKVYLLHLIKLTLKVLIDSHWLLYKFMALFLCQWNGEGPFIDIFSDQWLLIDLIQQIQFCQPLLIELLQIGNNSLPLRLHIRAHWLTLSIICKIGVIRLA